MSSPFTRVKGLVCPRLVLSCGGRSRDRGARRRRSGRSRRGSAGCARARARRRPGTKHLRPGLPRLLGQNGVIGGRVFPASLDQPPSYVYWTALQAWGLMRQPDMRGRWSRKRIENLLAGCILTWKPPGMNTETRARGVHSSRPGGYTHNDAHAACEDTISFQDDTHPSHVALCAIQPHTMLPSWARAVN